MFYINKIVGWILSPLGMVVIAAITSGVFLYLKRQRSAWISAIVAFALFWVFSMPLTTRIIGRPLESGYDKEGFAHGDVSWAPNAGAIVILGGGMACHQECGSAEMVTGADRVWVGAKLYKLGKAPKIICTGYHIANGTLPLLIDLGVPREDIIWYAQARNTEEEARQIANVFKSKGSKSKILLVTSAWHMDRAKFLFETEGVDVVPCPGDFEMSAASEKDFTLKEFLPDSYALMLNTAAVREWIGLCAYWILKG